MQYKSSHNLISWLLTLAVVFAPVQAAVSAIDMLDHGQPQESHCQMEKAANNQQDPGEQNDCCKSGIDCAKCISVHAMMTQTLLPLVHAQNSFDLVYKSLAQGVVRQAEFRPPRTFS